MGKIRKLQEPLGFRQWLRSRENYEQYFLSQHAKNYLPAEHNEINKLPVWQGSVKARDVKMGTF